MGWFDFLWKRDATPPEVVPDQTQIVDDVLLQALLNGETITREKVMTLPSVNGAVDFISNSIACMPVKLYKHKDGKVEEVEKDERVKMLNGGLRSITRHLRLDLQNTLRLPTCRNQQDSSQYCIYIFHIRSHLAAAKLQTIFCFEKSLPANRLPHIYLTINKISHMSATLGSRHMI